MLLTISLYCMAALYVFAGTMHLIKPGFFVSIMPPYLPYPRALVYVSGLAEIALGLALLVPALSPFAAWGVIALLIAVFPANVQMFSDRRKWRNIPAWLLAARLPLQLVLIGWAFLHT